MKKNSTNKESAKNELNSNPQRQYQRYRISKKQQNSKKFPSHHATMVKTPRMHRRLSNRKTFTSKRRMVPNRLRKSHRRGDSMNNRPVRLNKQEDYNFYNLLLKRVEAWAYAHATLLLAIAIIVFMILFIVLAYAIVGVSATGDTIYNGMEAVI